MSTDAIVAIAPTVTPIARAETWLKQHERLIIITLILLVSLWLGNKYLNNSLEKAKQTANVAVIQAQQAKTVADTDAQKATAALNQYQELVNNLTKQNQALTTAISQRTIVVQAQQVKDQTLPLPDLANRWQILTNTVSGDFTATTVGIQVSDTASRATVLQLEQIPVLQADIKDTQTVIDNQVQEIAKADSVNNTLELEVTSLQNEIKVNDTACKAQITSINKSNRKSKLNWFLRGLGTGATIIGYILK